MASSRPNREKPDQRRDQQPLKPNERWPEDSPRATPERTAKNTDEACSPLPDDDTGLWSFVFEDDIDAD